MHCSNTAMHTQLLDSIVGHHASYIATIKLPLNLFSKSLRLHHSLLVCRLQTFAISVCLKSATQLNDIQTLIMWCCMIVRITALEMGVRCFFSYCTHFKFQHFILFDVFITAIMLRLVRSGAQRRIRNYCSALTL